MKKISLIILLSLITATGVHAESVGYSIDAANSLAKQGIIVDNSANPSLYNLESNILRQEMAGVIVNTKKISAVENCNNHFSDVTNNVPNEWACKSIEALLEQNLIAKNEIYRPTAFVSKAEAVGFILNSLYQADYKKYAQEHPKTSWEKNAIDFAKKQKVISKSPKEYTETANRSFIFNMLYKAIEQRKKGMVQVPHGETADLNGLNLEKLSSFANKHGIIDLNTIKNTDEIGVDIEQLKKLADFKGMLILDSLRGIKGLEIPEKNTNKQHITDANTNKKNPLLIPFLIAGAIISALILTKVIGSKKRKRHIKK